jgi:phosphoribosylanthranilate isomerase
VTLGVKICCMSDEREVELAIAEGASALGFVSEEPPGRGRLPLPAIARLIQRVAGRAPCWLLTTDTTAPAILARVEATRPDAVQLCDAVPPSEIAELRAAAPHLRLIQVVHVEGPAAVDEALAAAPLVDALLLDSGVTSGPERRLGGTGRTHDWGISAAIVARASIPVWLAGGLGPENVAAAVAAVRPAGVDLCSGVRDADYRLDAALLRSFIRAALVADGPLVLPEGATVAELQRSVLLLEARMGWLDADAEACGFRMVEEVGELHRAIRELHRARDRGDDLAALRAAAGAEIADVLNYLLAIANRLGVDVERASREKNLENQRRTWD